MKRFMLFVLIKLAIAPVLHSAGRVWSSLGPEGGDSSTVAIDPTNPAIIYAGTYSSGIYKSTDSGATWRAVNNGIVFAIINITFLTIDPHTPANLYAGTDYFGVYKSTDGGGNWISSSNGFLIQTIYSLAIDPVNTSVVYAATQYGAFRSIDECRIV